jgi:hypothetical protein
VGPSALSRQALYVDFCGYAPFSVGHAPFFVSATLAGNGHSFWEAAPADEGQRAALGVGYPVMPRASAPLTTTWWRTSAILRSVGCGISKVTRLTVPVNANGNLSA